MRIAVETVWADFALEAHLGFIGPIMAQQDQENQSQHRRRAMTNGFDSSSVNCKIQGRREMAGLRRLAQLKPIAEEALAGTVFVAKFLCGLHVANTYICTAALVSSNFSPL